jgi:hypothetical protein
MTEKLYYSTVGKSLLSVLKKLMSAKEFVPFRMVGGTALSLQIGHRMSVDIDMFTDSPSGSLDFLAIEKYLHSSFPFVSTSDHTVAGMGKAYRVGADKMGAIKLDVYYTDPFIRPALVVDGIRMATAEEIIAMKLDIISRSGRKKDFWDLHELMKSYTLAQMLALHKERYPYSHDAKKIKENFSNFSKADDDIDPECLLGKHWEVIKLDMQDFVSGA